MMVIAMKPKYVMKIAENPVHHEVANPIFERQKSNNRDSTRTEA